MSQEWYYSHNGQRHGPVSGADLKQLAASGKLQPTDHVWKEGMDRWAAARSVKGLFPAASAPVATTTPPPPLPARKSPHPAEPVEVADAEPILAPQAAEAVQEGPVKDEKSGLIVGVKNRLQTEKWKALFEKAKAKWRASSTPVKAGVVGGVVGGGLLLLLLFCILPLTWFFGGSTGSSAVPIRQIAEDYAKDRAAADAKYGGKVLTVTGVIAIPADDAFRDTVQLELGPELSSKVAVDVQFSAKYEEVLKKQKRGTEITFRGQCQEVSKKIGSNRAVVRFTDCELISPSEGGGKSSGMNPAGDSSPATKGLEPDEFAERLRKLTKAKKWQPNTIDGNQAASMMGRPQPLSPKWKNYGPFKLYAIQSNDHFRAGDAFRAVGRPDRVLQGPFLSTFIDPPGKDWQEWVWLRNGVTYRCFVTNVTALRDGRAELEVREGDEVGIASPGLLVGGGADF